MVNLYLYVVGAMVMFSLLAAKKETATWFSVALSVRLEAACEVFGEEVSHG